MTELNPKHSLSDDPESLTRPRYSLAYDLIGSADTIVRHVSGNVRLVSYDKPTPKQAKIRKRLLERGLVLGTIISEPNDQQQLFRVPKSARPIAYDAQVQSSGAFSYNDEQLFFDLGHLLGELHEITDMSYVIDGDIGRAVAFVEFTDPGERQLFLAPGIEKTLKHINHQTKPLDYYSDSLTQTFGHRFEQAIYYFGMGFTEALVRGE